MCLEPRGPVRVGEAETFHDTLRSANAVHREGTNGLCAEGDPVSVEAPSCLCVVLSFRGVSAPLAELLL